MANTSELVAKIIQLTKEEKIFWKPKTSVGNCANYKDVDILFGNRNGWSLRDFLWINGIRVEVDKKDKTQLLNAILEKRGQLAVHIEEKKKQGLEEGIKILMEA